MNRFKSVLLAACVASGALGVAASASAESLEPILEVGKQRTADAKASQAKIDRLADETRDLLSDYKTVMKQIDGLKVYNARLERQIANQNRRITDIDSSVAEAAVIQRQIPPLVARMLDGLEQFVALDYPFELDRREGNIEAVRSNLDRSDVTSAEAFRQVLELYSIELQYGRGIESYAETIELNGVEREVNILRIGRIALIYQSTDGAETGAWNNETRSWEPLSAGDYARAVRTGIRIANKQATIELLNMPIAAPEAN
ncbi:TonB system biopolymer transport component [Luminiphilus syltensis NOR5-1B]|uniref:TonB system biopolymer transport component n=2 Tax=Luminiphilus TaxID=1341118 RepID=B8KU39_9GAMM|nr:TonB system biopolymer transport component [Luminiphilus syltensis NOR5-1B]